MAADLTTMTKGAYGIVIYRIKQRAPASTSRERRERNRFLRLPLQLAGKSAISVLTLSKYIFQQIQLAADIRMTKLDAWRNCLLLHSRQRNRFPEPEINRYFGVRGLPLCGYNCRQVWIATNNTTTKNDVWSNRNLPHFKTRSVMRQDRNRFLRMKNYCNFDTRAMNTHCKENRYNGEDFATFES